LRPSHELQVIDAVILNNSIKKLDLGCNIKPGKHVVKIAQVRHSISKKKIPRNIFDNFREMDVIVCLHRLLCRISRCSSADTRPSHRWTSAATARARMPVRLP
jgi:hypothetical protein